MASIMDALELLATRASNGKLRDPAPDDATLRTLVESALRAPDHGLLRPFRLLVVRGAARERLGLVMREALLRRKPAAEAEELDKEQRKPLRAPLLIVVTAHPRPAPKVPEIEQVLAAGAVAYGLVLAAQAHGYAAMWRTGPAVYDPMVKHALGLADTDHIVGIVYVGTAAVAAPPVARPGYDDSVSEWTESVR